MRAQPGTKSPPYRRVPTIQSFGSHAKSAPPTERIPVSQRLGTQTDAEDSTVMRVPAKALAARVQGSIAELPKRKPGRPPGRKVAQSSPKLTAGSTSHKRKIQGSKPPTYSQDTSDRVSKRKIKTALRNLLCVLELEQKDRNSHNL
ncbi:hypothetical protein YC2023_059350 [Brassica napus]